MKLIRLFVLVASLYSLGSTTSIRRATFIKNLSQQQSRPFNFVSLMKLTSYEQVKFDKGLSNSMFVAERPTVDFSNIKFNQNDVFIADLNDNSTVNFLNQAKVKNFIKSPARWILLYRLEDNDGKIEPSQNNDTSIKRIIELEKHNVEEILQGVNLVINSEIYVAFDGARGVYVFLVHQISPHQRIIWEEYGIWTEEGGIDRKPPTQSIALRRRNLQGRRVVATAIMFDNGTLSDMKDFRRPTVDAETKLTYYLVYHLFELLNASGEFNATDSWGYSQSNDSMSYNGIMGEMQHGRSELSTNRLFFTKKRMAVAEYVLNPFSDRDGLSLPTFILLKPSLATVTNIYVLPFTVGVWICLSIVLVLASLLLYLAFYREAQVNKHTDKSVLLRLSQSFTDIISLVLQQGTAHDPVSLCCRQIILLGVMSFMFLYTAYSANVVSLLQSTTNEINSIEALLRSPVKIGAHDVSYNRHFFETDNRPVYRDLFMKKGLPQGEKFYVSLEEGIRRVQQGLYAFHAQANLCLELIQQTYLEHEKCNLAFVNFMPVSGPHFVVRKESDIKEQMRIGAFHIRESGLLSRAIRRLVSTPKCDSSTAIFTEVSLLQVAPAFKCLLILYGCAIAILVIEVLVKRKTLN